MQMHTRQRCFSFEPDLNASQSPIVFARGSAVMSLLAGHKLTIPGTDTVRTYMYAFLHVLNYVLPRLCELL